MSQDVFEIIHSTRAMRRLKPDPVPDELIINGSMYQHDARLRSFQIAAEAMQSLGSAEAAE